MDHVSPKLFDGFARFGFHKKALCHSCSTSCSLCRVGPILARNCPIWGFTILWIAYLTNSSMDLRDSNLIRKLSGSSCATSRSLCWVGTILAWYWPKTARFEALQSCGSGIDLQNRSKDLRDANFIWRPLAVVVQRHAHFSGSGRDWPDIGPELPDLRP